MRARAAYTFERAPGTVAAHEYARSTSHRVWIQPSITLSAGIYYATLWRTWRRTIFFAAWHSLPRYIPRTNRMNAVIARAITFSWVVPIKFLISYSYPDKDLSHQCNAPGFFADLFSLEIVFTFLAQFILKLLIHKLNFQCFIMLWIT